MTGNDSVSDVLGGQEVFVDVALPTHDCGGGLIQRSREWGAAAQSRRWRRLAAEASGVVPRAILVGIQTDRKEAVGSMMGSERIGMSKLNDDLKKNPAREEPTLL